MADAIGTLAGEWPPPRGSWDVLVNATSAGSATAPGDTAFAGPFDGEFVYDLVYDPDPTELMRRAQLAGCPAIGGLEMLVAQAERQFEMWPGERPPADLFAEAAASATRARAELPV